VRETRIIGILNMTEDSFSDGGLFLAPERAVRRARELVAAGADFIELGAASSHPEARPVLPDEEIRRLAPVCETLLGEGVRLSVDTRNPATQRFCLERDIDILNDIEGFPDPAFYPELARARCKLVVMHSIVPGERAPRVHTPPDAVMSAIEGFFRARVTALTRAGVARERIVLDPGMGLFLGSNPEPSFRVLAHLGDFRERFETAMLVSVSRKGFLGDATGRGVAERGAATLAAEIWAALQGVAYIRTHDVASLRDALRVIGAIESG